jgi:uncharacterized protein YciI
LKSLKNTKIIGAPHFPYDANTLMLECDVEAEDGGFKQIENFVTNDPYVQNKLVKSYNIREFALKGAVSDFDRLSEKYVVRS